jgi:hypothetical protein
MTKKTSKTASANKPTSKNLVAVFSEPSDPEVAKVLAKVAVRPSVNAAVVMMDYTQQLGDQDLGSLIDCLSDGAVQMSSGDMKRAEAMLYGQAHALQAIFTDLACRAKRQDLLKQWDAYLRMALKAQNQCRMTLETLATIKNPPVVFARQANINNGGNQQVNNGAAPAAPAGPAHAGNPEISQTELLETSDGKRLDTGAAGAAGGADPRVEAVAKINRTTKR